MLYYYYIFYIIISQFDVVFALLTIIFVYTKVAIVTYSYIGRARAMMLSGETRDHYVQLARQLQSYKKWKS